MQPTFAPARVARLAATLAPWHPRDDARDALDAATDWGLAPAELDALVILAILARVEESASREPRRARLDALIEAGATVGELEGVFGARETAEAA